MKSISVIKRSGEKEELDLAKLHKVVSWACEGLSGVSASEVEIKSQIQFYDKIKSTDIQETMIKAAADLISEETPNYQYVAARLINYHLRKEVYSQIDPWHLSSIIERGIEKKLYTRDLHTLYNGEEIEILNNYIDHDRDYDYTYCAMEQWRGKYLIRNRQTNRYIETPQVALMLISMLAFSGEKENRLSYVKNYYDALSKFYITIPTPILGGLRTTQKQFSSCVLIDVDDTLDSINAAASATVKYVSQRAGIGLNVGGIRAIGSKVRDGLVSHTGLIPFIKYFQAAIKSCSQGSIRGGAGTLHFPFWHYEIEDLLVLKNNKGTEDVRARHLDYSVQFNKLMYERLIEDSYITLFSPNEVPGLYEAFFNDQEKFRTLYEAAEKNTRIRKKQIKASELFTAFMQERKDTGRLYLMNVDHCNTHSSFMEDVAPIKMSNLCQEISLPVKPLANISDEHGEIALCTLSAINFGKFKNPTEMKPYCEIAVRALDNILDYQSYPVIAAEIATKNRRPLGIGITNLAYWLAKRNYTYDDVSAEALEDLHTWMEHWSYYLINASADLAIERGKCPLNDETRYGHGILPIDTYKEDVDILAIPIYNCDWVGLTEKLQLTGIRNSTIMAQMPCECQHWENKLNLSDNRELNFHELLEEQGIDWRLIEGIGLQQRYPLFKPVFVKTRHGDSMVNEIYYNGYQEVFEVEFEDGKKYKFTANHKFLVSRGGKETWVELKDLRLTDNVVSTDAIK